MLCTKIDRENQTAEFTGKFGEKVIVSIANDPPLSKVIQTAREKLLKENLQKQDEENKDLQTRLNSYITMNKKELENV